MKLSDIEKQINILQESMRLSFRRTVEDAIKIGELLTIAKKQLPHGEFMPWCKKQKIPIKTVARYLKLPEYKNKFVNVTNLTEAYKLIESEENKRKRIEFEEQTKRIREYNKTGIKPDGWDRSTEYEYQKRIKEHKERTERIEKAKKEKKENEYSDNYIDNDEVDSLIKELRLREEKKNEFYNKMRMTGDNSKDPIYDALLEYLLELDESNRLEACHNIIKFCKTIANELQVKSVN